MIKTVIIEDEAPAAKKLGNLLRKMNGDVTVSATLDSIEESVKWFQVFPQPDLVFMDIQLADGLSFEIFRQVNITAPVIFTTAYDQYMLHAFKNNGIEYLLKPLDAEQLEQAMQKFRQFFGKKENNDLAGKIGALLQQLQPPVYRERFLVKSGQQLYYVNTADIACLYAEGKLAFALDFSGKRHLMDDNLSTLETQLPPNDFYKVSRHLVVNIKSVRRIHPWFGGRLKLELQPAPDVELEVSRERVAGFKEWLGK
ncbi:LytR/AlgR family response regulator transcription factor [Chitinophaga sp. GCM10012297]|uniref:Response regulator transcription factor n=1 Tax=Chitinophaga chungangae TaxID=2821488 RepID=A0ABS3YAN5_9BACT|nr:LytTR family DNA-binding domain-containing protein [Chitinophaga chungangae]MBO9151742.1 response regulator transcription factor [Chitinophaga chungangae]